MTQKRKEVPAGAPEDEAVKKNKKQRQKHYVDDVEDDADIEDNDERDSEDEDEDGDEVVESEKYKIGSEVVNHELTDDIPDGSAMVDVSDDPLAVYLKENNQKISDVANIDYVSKFIGLEKLKIKEIYEVKVGSYMYALGKDKFSHLIQKGLPIVIHNKKASYSMPMQLCRWYSTAVSVHVQGYSSADEIQGLYDASKNILFVAANTTDSSRFPSEVYLAKKIDFESDVKGLRVKEVKKAEFEKDQKIRHCKKLQQMLLSFEMASQVAKEIDNGAAACASSKTIADKSMNDEFTIATKPEVIALNNGECHAEIFLLKKWQEKYLVNNSPLENTVHLFVGGVKRPCFACYIRLSLKKKELLKKNVVLHMKESSGPYWVNKTALAGCTYGELEAISRGLASITVTLSDGYAYNEDTASEDETGKV